MFVAKKFAFSLLLFFLTTNFAFSQNTVHRFPSTSPLILKGLQYCCIGDTAGAGIEMKSREWLLRNWSLVSNELVYVRPLSHSVGLEKGWYTDDTELSLGLLKALHKEKMLHPDTVICSFLDAYDTFRDENNGIGRGGYGSFGEVAQKENINRLAEWKKIIRERKYAPGNGATMRILPTLLYAKENYPTETNVLLHNVIVQTIATHNHTNAVLTSLAFIDTANAIIEELIPFEKTIEYTLDFLTQGQKFDHTLPSMSQCFLVMQNLSNNYDIPLNGEFFEDLEMFIQRLQIIDQLESPYDDIGSNMDSFIDLIIDENWRGGQESGETGLACRSPGTLFATLYCWKWSLKDFGRMANINEEEAYFSLMKRCISFGGDVDTLLAYVIPVSFLRIEKIIGSDATLPSWLIESCVELDRLEERFMRSHTYSNYSHYTQSIHTPNISDPE